jgi:hypothetical protein
MKPLRWSIAVMLLAVVIAGQSLGLAYRVDSCLDRGGSYIYEKDGCSMNPDAVAAPAGSWLRAPKWEAVVIALIIAAAIAFGPEMIRARRGNSRPPGGAA